MEQNENKSEASDSQPSCDNMDPLEFQNTYKKDL